MTPNEAAQVLHVLTSAWPWAQWPDPTVELWMVALAPHDFQPALATARRAMVELERPPSVAWFHGAAKAEADRNAVYVPELDPVPVDKATTLAGIAAAREALKASRRP